MRMFLVGGAVRDSFLGIQSKDRDYAVEGETFQSMLANVQSMAARPQDVYEIRPEFHTIRANLPGFGAADFVLCRKDGQYSDGRRPDSVESGTILDDLARRDFTMNAIAIDVETSKVIDPFGGRKDIEQKIIRCVGDSSTRFSEDALRLLRAIRFSVTKGFTMTNSVEAALRNSQLTDRLSSVSMERVREELEKAFRHDTLATLAALEAFPLIKFAAFANKEMRLSATMKA